MGDEQLVLQLKNYLTDINLDLPDAKAKTLIAYLHQLAKWNAHVNLTAIDEMEKMITHHLVDSLAIAPYVTGKNIADIGTGAGLPGLPLAVYYPDKSFTLLDAVGKKIRFLVQMKAELGIPNIFPIHARAESFSPDQLFDVIIFRAVGKIDDYTRATASLLAPGGCWLFMKGTYPQEELDALELPTETIVLDLPSIGAERHLIRVTQK